MKRNILLVEYDHATICALKETLPPPLFEVDVAADGDLAKELLSRKRFDLMVTAAMLPRFHGFNLSLSVANERPDIKIIIISAVYKGIEYKHQAVTQYKASDFFEKPLDTKRFRTRVLELLNLTEEDLIQTPEPEPVPEPEVLWKEEPEAEPERVSMVIDLDEEENKLTSEDIFADIIEKVERIPPKFAEPDPSFEIDFEERSLLSGKEEIEFHPLDEAHSQDPSGAVESAVPETPETAGLPDAPAPASPSAEKPDRFKFRKGVQIEDILREELLGPQIDRPRQDEKQKREERQKEEAAAKKIDLDFADMLLDRKPSLPEEAMKKIEEEIAKKLEETLSGLGIGKKDAPAARVQGNKAGGVLEELLGLKTPVAAEKQPDELGDYVILGLIARGGMAEIYKAKKKGPKGFEKVIAIKKILSGYVEDDKFIEMLVDEAKIAAELSHPNIVQIYDLGKKDDYYFIAMEYVLGKDLREIQRRLGDWNIRFPEQLSLFLVIKVLEALNYAHAAKDSRGRSLDIVHRDVSPPNILISYNGDIKLADFGVSKTSIKIHQTISGALKGKLLYMSPEQARGEENIDYRSDLYSVGVILFELITGKKLFMDSSEMGVLKKVQSGEVARPSMFVTALDPELERIILKSLERDRAKRYQSAAEMISDLEMVIIRKYPYIPGPVHLAHFVCNLFKDEITQEGVQVELKPIPEKSIPKTQVGEQGGKKGKREDEIPVTEKSPDRGKTVEISLEDEDPKLSEIRETGKASPAVKSGNQRIEDLLSEMDRTNRHSLRLVLLILLAVAVIAAGVYFLVIRKNRPPVSRAVEGGATVSQLVASRQDLHSPPKDIALSKESQNGVLDSTSLIPISGANAAPAGGIAAEPISAKIDVPALKTPVVADIPAANETTAPKREEPSSFVPEEKPLPVGAQVQEGGVADLPKTAGPGSLIPTAPESGRTKEGDLVPLGAVDSPPVAVSAPDPVVPASVKNAMLGAERLMVSFLVDENGNVLSVSLPRKSRIARLNSILTDTIRNWKFTPAVKDNLRVKVWKTISIAINK